MTDTLELEILAPGVHNGVPFTVADLEEIAANANALSEYVKPPIKISHQDDHNLPFIKEFAFGAVKALRVAGGKLLATLGDLPQFLRDAINQGRLSRCSVEVLLDWQGNPSEKNLRTGVKGKVLSALALLGITAPAVRNLRDIPRVLADDTPTPAPGTAVLCLHENPTLLASRDPFPPPRSSGYPGPLPGIDGTLGDGRSVPRAAAPRPEDSLTGYERAAFLNWDFLNGTEKLLAQLGWPRLSAEFRTRAAALWEQLHADVPVTDEQRALVIGSPPPDGHPACALAEPTDLAHGPSTRIAVTEPVDLDAVARAQEEVRRGHVELSAKIETLKKDMARTEALFAPKPSALPRPNVIPIAPAVASEFTGYAYLAALEEELRQRGWSRLDPIERRRAAAFVERRPNAPKATQRQSELAINYPCADHLTDGRVQGKTFPEALSIVAARESLNLSERKNYRRAAKIVAQEDEAAMPEPSRLDHDTYGPFAAEFAAIMAEPLFGTYPIGGIRGRFSDVRGMAETVLLDEHPELTPATAPTLHLALACKRREAPLMFADAEGQPAGSAQREATLALLSERPEFDLDRAFLERRKADGNVALAEGGSDGPLAWFDEIVDAELTRRGIPRPNGDGFDDPRHVEIFKSVTRSLATKHADKLNQVYHPKPVDGREGHRS